MTKKLGVGIVVLIVILAIVGVYLHSRKPGAPAQTLNESELSYEEQTMDQDLAELDQMLQDTSLDSLDQDLASIIGEEAVTNSQGGEKVETDSIVNLESDLSAELDGLSADISDLEAFENDSLLDNLDSGLSEVSE